MFFHKNVLRLVCLEYTHRKITSLRIIQDSISRSEYPKETLCVNLINKNSTFKTHTRMFKTRLENKQNTEYDKRSVDSTQFFTTQSSPARKTAVRSYHA